MKRILITGAKSYIGTSLARLLTSYPDDYSIDLISLRDDRWKCVDFARYDVVLHLAALVHQKETPDKQCLYFGVNRDLAIEVAKRAKASEVKQFVFMSTMAVYGEEGTIGKITVIRRDTPPNPKTLYGKSKLEAENEIARLQDDGFKVVILRPPMIYGPNCPGNFSKLDRLASIVPFFPLVENKRSMLSVEKLCHDIKDYVDSEEEGLFFPQDDDYANTSLLVRELAKRHGRRIYLSKTMGRIITLLGNRIGIISRIFGSLIYDIG